MQPLALGGGVDVGLPVADEAPRHAHGTVLGAIERGTQGAAGGNGQLQHGLQRVAQLFLQLDALEQKDATDPLVAIEEGNDSGPVHGHQVEVVIHLGRPGRGLGRIAHHQGDLCPEPTGSRGRRGLGLCRRALDGILGQEGRAFPSWYRFRLARCLPQRHLGQSLGNALEHHRLFALRVRLL